ncbi:MAG TPA: cation diffusion facilitator family transporter [Luteibacter sp.]|jgi:cation diffusion facilitator family transporter|nr:cation diffusion facilitator family transporter [Luteibacter sp.]
MKSRVSNLAALSIPVGLLVLGLKFLAWRLTGSVALYSDALESIINVVTAITAFIAIRVSAMPADEGHPYGHTKAEYFSAVLEGVLIVVAALAILHEAWQGFTHPHPLDAPLTGILINSVATAINLAWGLLLIRDGKKARSPALVADGQHLMTDVYTSAGVLVALVAVTLTRWYVLDSIIAAAVALNILWSGWSLMKESVGGLMDASLPSEELERIESVLNAVKSDDAEIRALRTRRAGPRTFVDFSLIVPGTMSVNASHAMCDRLEDALEQELPDVSIRIHVEPAGKPGN